MDLTVGNTLICIIQILQIGRFLVAAGTRDTRTRLKPEGFGERLEHGQVPIMMLDRIDPRHLGICQRTCTSQIPRFCREGQLHHLRLDPSFNNPTVTHKPVIGATTKNENEGSATIKSLSEW